MTEPTKDEPSGVDDIKAEVERTRAELADTVDQLSDKLNPKTQASKKVESVKESAAELKDTAAEKVADVKSSATEAKDTAAAKATELKDTAAEKASEVKAKAPEPVRQGLDQLHETSGSQRGLIALGVVGAVVAIVVVRRRRQTKVTSLRDLLDR